MRCACSCWLLLPVWWCWRISGEEPSWAPKYEPAQYPPGVKPHTKLADLRSKYKGQANWREVIVDDHPAAQRVHSGCARNKSRPTISPAILASGGW